MITRIFLMKLFIVITETLMFHQWSKMENFPESDFEIKRNTDDSRASRRIENNLDSYKQIIDCGGNGLKTPKFYQMLHLCAYIQRHGSPLNYNGSRGEDFGKVKIKDNAKLIRKQKGVFNFDIGHRISEEGIIDNASNIFQPNNG